MIDGIEVFVCARPEFIVNVCNCAGIGIRRLKNSGDGSTFFVKKRDFSAFCELMTRHCKEYKTLNDKTISGFFRRNLPRFGLYAGLAFVIFACVFYSLKVTRVEIAGNSLVSYDAIMEAVAEAVELPCERGKVDRKSIEQAIIALDGIASASVEQRGNTLLVNVYEELEKAEVQDKSDYTDVKSLYDGIITRVIVYSGTAAVKAGDTVKKGQTLISSDVVIDENLTAKEKASGGIYARVWVTKTQVFTPTVIVRRRTGRTETAVGFFKPDEGYKCDFSLYETETKEYYLDSVIPLKYYVTTFYEIEEAETEFDFDSNEEAVVKSMTEALEEELPEGCVSLRSWYVKKRLDKNVQLDIYYEIEIKIN